MTKHQSPQASRGMAESVQWAILMPLVVTCVIGVIGVSQWLSGRSAAQDAAFAGAESGAVSGDDAVKAATAAAARVAESSGLVDVVVVTQLQDGQLSVEVSARVPTFLPNGVDPTVHGRATRSKEE